MKKINQVLVLCLLASWSQATLAAEADPKQCAMCHAGKMAPVINLTSQQITEKLNGFKSGNVAGKMMPKIAKNLTDDDIKRLSVYFGKKGA